MELQVIKASGSHYEIGFAVGAAAKKNLESSISAYREILPREGWSGGWQLSLSYLEAATRESPDFVEEIRGMAAGSGQPFEALFFLNALEEALDEAGPAACTSIGLATGEAVYLGHNEDWYSADAAHVILLHARPSGKPAFISVTAAPFIAAVGINECGIAQGVNSVSSTDTRTGTPRMFAARAVLDAAGLEEAVAKATPPGRAGGYNHLLVSRDGRLVNLETSALRHSFTPAAGYIAHTNHYIAPSMLPLEKEAAPSSLSRLNQVNAWKEILLKRSDPLNALIELLRDHSGAPDSICRHPANDEGRETGTIFSAIFDLKGFGVWTAAGNPCRSAYRYYSGRS